MNCLWFRLLVCMKCARHVENSSGLWQLKQGKHKIFWAGQSLFLLHGAFRLKFLPVKSGVLSIHVMNFLVCREYKWMLFFLPCHSFWSGIVFGLYIDAHLMQRLRICGAFPPLFFISAWHGA
jgi:hypothetical protein